MKQVVFFLEEDSAKWMLMGLVPRLLDDHVNVLYIVFNGKTDLQNNLEKKMRHWQNPDAIFIVIQDRDSNDCLALKNTLRSICDSSNKIATIRIACGELESFYLGDLQAVEKGLELSGLASKQGSAKFRDPDRLGNASEELRKLTGGQYQKVSGSRSIAKHLDLTCNKSRSFQLLVKTIQSL